MGARTILGTGRARTAPHQLFFSFPFFPPELMVLHVARACTTNSRDGVRHLAVVVVPRSGCSERPAGFPPDVTVTARCRGLDRSIAGE
jgi:hypothetical protein